MIKNTNKFTKESNRKRRDFLQKLSITQAVKTLEKLLSSKLLTQFIHQRKDQPLSLEKLLKHAKLPR